MRDYALLRKYLQDDLKVEEHILTSDMSLESARRLWLANSFWKKFQDEIKPEADKACLELFNGANTKCASFVFKPESVQDDEVIGEVKSLWSDIVGNGPVSNIKTSEILDAMGVGPGASIGASSYDFYSKLFSSPLTGTSESLYRYYRYSIMTHPTWVCAEKAREDRFGHLMVVGNRLSFVPKTSDISRSICTEPSLNMLLQKGVGHVLETWLRKRFKINLSTQPDLNRQLAQRGSIDGSFGTIDLSSASDSISLKMLQEILPTELLCWLDLARSPRVVYPDGTSNELHMVSSMGNGFTFPLETLLFTTIVVACYRVLGVKPSYGENGPENYAVFGDDIIVRKDCYAFVTRALKLFGFSVNDQKSFNTGNFRESCGGDYLHGHDIRGVYCKSLRTSADVYSTINRLIRWSARTGVLLPQVITYLRGMVKHLPIPYHDGDAEGVKVPYAPVSSKRDYNTGAVIYKALVKRKRELLLPTSNDEDEKAIQKRKPKVSFNPDGLIVSLVGGYIRDGRIGVRSTHDTFKIRRRSTPCWSYWSNRSTMRDQVDRWIGAPSTSWRLDGEVDLFGLGNDWVVVADLYGLLS